jgi:manganese/zinc/iron transport system permease protein
MVCTSITAVGAFDVVGSLVVVALMIVPAATASLLAYRLIDMIVISLIIAISGAVGGYGLAIMVDGSIAGSIAVVLGLFFVLALFGAPNKGIFSRALYFRTMHTKLETKALVAYLHNQSAQGVKVELLAKELGWSAKHTQQICAHALREQLLINKEGKWYLSSHIK